MIQNMGWMIILVSVIIFSIFIAYVRNGGFSGVMFIGALTINVAIMIYYSELNFLYMIIPAGMLTIMIWSSLHDGGEPIE